MVAAVPTLLAGLMLTGTADGLAVGYAVGAAVAGIGYCALFLLLAVVTRNAVVAGLLTPSSGSRSSAATCPARRR